MRLRPLISLLLCSLAALSAADTPVSLGWSNYWTNGPSTALNDIAIGPGEICFGEHRTIGGGFSVTSFSTGMAETAPYGSIHWLSMIPSFGPNGRLFATWTLAQNTANVQWGLSSPAGTIIHGSSPFGNVVPLATQYVGGTGQFLIAEQYPYANGKTCLRVYDATSVTFKDDLSINPSQVAITGTGNIITWGIDNLSTSLNGGLRLCIYDSNLNLLHGETYPYPVGPNDNKIVYLVAASPNDAVYYIHNIQNAQGLQHDLVQFDCTNSTIVSSPYRSGRASLIVGAGFSRKGPYRIEHAAYVLASGTNAVEGFNGNGQSLFTKNLAIDSMAADTTGVYLGNSPLGASGHRVVQIIKCNESGVQQWTQQLASNNAGDLQMAGIAAYSPYLWVSATDSASTSPVAAEFVRGPSIIALAASSANVFGGLGGGGTITLSAAASSGGLAETLQNVTKDGHLTPASPATVAEGSSTGVFTFTTTGVDAATPETIVAQDPWGAFRTTGVTLQPATPAQIYAPSTATSGTTTSASLGLNGQTGPSGATVTFGASKAIQAPAPIKMGPYKGALSFSFVCTPVSSPTPSTITATLNGVTVQLQVEVDPPTLNTFTLTPSSALGQTNVSGSVGLDGLDAADVTVQLSTTSNAFTFTPASVTILANHATASFTFQTSAVSASTTGTIKATATGVTLTQSFTVIPADVHSLTLSSTSIVGGGHLGGTVTLNAHASSSGFHYTLVANNPPVSLPGGGDIGPSGLSGTFLIQTVPVDAASNQTITATGITAHASAVLHVLPASLSKLTFSPSPVMGGSKSTATLLLTGAAGPSGLTVTLSSDNASATVPASVHFNPGQGSVQFLVTTTAVATQTTVNIKATLTRDSTHISAPLVVE